MYCHTKVTALLCALVLLLLTTCNGKVTRFSLNRNMGANWFFMDKFCFDNLGDDFMGQIKWTLYSPWDAKLVRNFSLVLYDDEPPRGWQQLVRDLGKTDCKQRSNQTLYNIKALSPLEFFPNSTIYVTQSSHQWYWYMVLSACDQEPLEISEPLYIEMTWLNPGGFFSRHFSKDYQGVLPMFMFAFLPILAILGIVLIVNMACLVRLRTFHYIIRFFAVCFFCFVFSIFLSTIHYLVYAANGLGLYWLDDIGLVFRFISEIIFIMVLFLLASGWSITQPYIRHRTYLIIVFAILAVLYFAVFLWSQILVDQYSVQYVFETPPGMILAGVRPALLGFFLFVLWSTSRHEPNPKTKRFYLIIAIVFAFWFAILPVTVLIATLLPQFLKTKVIIGVDTVLQIIYMGIVIVMLWYSKAPEYFQYINDLTLDNKPTNNEEDETITLFNNQTPGEVPTSATTGEAVQTKKLYATAQQQYDVL